MSADFEKVLVKDPRLDVSDSIKYAVIKGGQNVTMAQFNAISATNSQLVFNIQVPSEQTIIDRRVLLQTTMNLEIVSTDVSGNYAVDASGVAVNQNTGTNYGVSSSLASFPLHQMMSVMSATINNNTVSINIRDVLPAIIRLLELDELVEYNNSSPTFLDTAASYNYGYGNLSNPLAGYWGVWDPRMVHRGSYTCTSFSQTILNSAGVAPVEGAFAAPYTFTERWSWQLTEPLLLSPFLFANAKANCQGFYGIQNMNFVLNIGDTARVFRGFTASAPSAIGNAAGNAGVANLATTYIPQGWTDTSGNRQGCTYAHPSQAPAGLPYISSVRAGWGDGTTLFTQGSTRLLFNFLTPHPSDLMPARNIVPFYELPRYITSAAAISAATLGVSTYGNTNGGSTNNYGSCLIPGVGSLKTNSLQLNQIPDKLVIFVRKLASKQSFGDPDVALPITNISINFNNNSGILSTAQTVDLWQMSRNNGCNNSWLDFYGQAFGSMPNNVGYQSQSVPPPFETNAQPRGEVLATAGSYLVLEFGKDIQLTEDFYAAGSLGNFNLQVNVNVANYNKYAFNNGDAEIVLITLNSGVFVCERGTSSTYTGILTKQDVLEASQQEHYTHNDVKRMVGGSFWDMLKSGVSKVMPLIKKGVKAAAPHIQEYALGKLKKHGPALLKKFEERTGLGGPTTMPYHGGVSTMPWEEKHLM